MYNLSYRHNNGDEPLKYLTLGQLAEITASQNGSSVAVDSVEQNKSLTYLEALNEADKFAAGLRKLGLRKGDRLGLWAPNCIEWYVINLACMRVGIILVTLNPANGTSEIEYSINKVGIKIIACPYEAQYHKYYDMLVDMAPELKKARRKDLRCHRLPSLEGIILISEVQTEGTYSYQEVIELASRTDIEHVKAYQRMVVPEDACYIHFSSGTTGKPKAIVLSHFQTVNNSYVIAKRCEINKKHHIICVQIPLFHVFGTVISIAAASHFGITLVLPSSFYNPTLNYKSLLEKKCSIIYGTPTMFIDLMNIQQNTQAKLNVELAVMGGAPTSSELCRRIKAVLNIKHIKNSYGLSETSSAVFLPVPGEDKGYDTVGYVGDHLQVKVVNRSGHTTLIGEPGEIYVRGYTVMLGYWGDEDKTKETITVDGWLKTGDIGILQSNGYAKIVGRNTDLIIRGGENIYPKEIEDFLSTHPNIVDVQVFGIPHDRLGEEVYACIRLKTGCTMTKSQLREYCKGKLAHSKIPTQLKIVEKFPKTLTGKVQKGILRETICNGRTI